MSGLISATIHCLSEALSPLTHMAGAAGNESIINRTKVLHGGRLHDVPALSGNAIRHSMVREPGAWLLGRECGLYGKLNIDQANYLFDGGALTESQTGGNMKAIAEMQGLMPLVRLLGGSLRNQVVSGSLLVGMGALVCEENRVALRKLLPEELAFGLPALRPCEDYVANYRYTRGDAGGSPALADEGEEGEEGRECDEEEPGVAEEPGKAKKKAKQKEGKSNLMIYSGQHVTQGAVFYHSFILQNVGRLEVGALYAALKDWEAAGGTVGGMARIGHGKLATAIYDGGRLDFEACETEYREHTAENAERIAGWLGRAFPAKAKKAPGGPAGGAGGEGGFFDGPAFFEGPVGG